MKKSRTITKVRSERNSSNVFPLAVAVGLMAFFITGEVAGGVTAVQGFFVGMLAVLFLYVLAGMLDSHRAGVAERTLSLPSERSASQGRS